jgi:hypothetical protein
MVPITITFTADSGDELAELLRGYVASGGPPEWFGKTPPPSEPKILADAESLSDEDYDVRYSDDDNGQMPIEPGPQPQPVKAQRKPRSRAVPAPAATLLGSPNGPDPAAAAAATAQPEPVQTPPPPPPAPTIELPQLDALKQVVTLAVRQAQKGEGSRTILELLPAFKTKTGLAFVMEAQDQHRPALYELVQAAGLAAV